LGALQASVSGSVAGAHAESDKNSYASTMRMHDEDQGPPPRFSINVKFLRRAYVAAMLAASQAKPSCASRLLRSFVCWLIDLSVMSALERPDLISMGMIREPCVCFVFVLQLRLVPRGRPA
jgi:hypothetical protein